MLNRIEIRDLKPAKSDDCFKRFCFVIEQNQCWIGLKAVFMNHFFEL